MKLFFIIIFVFFIGCSKNEENNPSSVDDDYKNPQDIEAPTNFFAKAISLNEVHLSWSHSKGSNINYRIFKNGQYLTTTNSLNYIDRFTLNQLQQYEYYIKAIENDGRESASSNLSITSIISGSLNDQVVKNTFNISIAFNRALYFSVNVDPTLNLYEYWNGRIFIFDGVSRIFTSQGPSGGSETSINTGPYPLKAGNYKIEVNRTSGYGNYKLTLYFTQSLINNDLEPNDGIHSAKTISINKYIEGHLGYLGGGDATYDEKDFYYLTVNKKVNLKCNVIVDPSLNLYEYWNGRIFIYKNDGVTKIFSLNGPKGGSETSVSGGPYTFEPGNYYIEVRRMSGFGGYKIKFYE